MTALRLSEKTAKEEGQMSSRYDSLSLFRWPNTGGFKNLDTSNNSTD